MTGSGDDNTISINAWTGTAVPTGELHPNARRWGTQKRLPEYPSTLAAPEPVDQRDWAHKDVGWGLILPDNDAIAIADRARGADVPPSIRTLLDARPGSPIFRYRADVPPGFVRRYFSDGRQADIALSGSDRGIGDGKLPMYLLIAGTPVEIPWTFQYLLNVVAFTGRLDLPEDARARYVAALIGNWKNSAISSNRPVVWAVDHGQPDITWLMRRTIADPVAELMRNDTDIRSDVTHLAGAAATRASLIDALATAKPSMVVTTSHGLTGPLDDPAAMRAQLGFLVDDAGASVTPDAVLDGWQPDGVVWYAHACCSAGSDGTTSYAGLVSAGSSVEETLLAVAKVGATVAPLPTALLSAAKPARAFIGQVEPTFNYTLRNPENRQVLTSSIQKALYNRMFLKQPETVGMALAGCYRHVGELFAQWQQLLRDVSRAIPNAREMALRTQLMAIDRQSMVILGDPTVAIPPLTSRDNSVLPLIH